MDTGYDFTNFGVARALSSAERSSTSLERLREQLEDLATAMAREPWDPAAVSGKLDALTRQDPALANALRSRIAGRPQQEIVGFLGAVSEAVTAMSTAANHGRLSTRLRDAIIYATLP